MTTRFKTTHILPALVTASLAVSLTAMPAAAQVGIGVPDAGIGIGGRSGSTAPSSRYAMPPGGMMVRSALAGVNTDAASIEDLAEVTEGIGRNLDECESTGRRLELELSAGRDNRAVHPDWIRRYQDCLQQTEDDVGDMKDILESRSSSADADKLAGLKADLEEVENDLDDAFDDQRRLVSEYNFGG